MKFKKIILLFLLTYNYCFSQTSLTIRNNYFFSSTNEEIIDIDTLLLKPFGENTQKSFSFDLAFRKYTKKNIGLIVRAGYERFETKQYEDELRSNGANGFRQISSRQESSTFLLNLGLFHEQTANNKITFQAGLEIPLLYQPKRVPTLKIDYYDEDGVYESGYLLNLGIPRKIGIGLNCNFNAYYHFTKRVGVGMEMNIQFMYENRKGNAFENPKSIDKDGNIVEELNIPHLQKSNSFQRGFFASLGVRYKISANQ